MSEIQHDEQEQIKQRRQKLTDLRTHSIAFPTDFRRNSMAGELLTRYQDLSKDALEAEPIRVKLAGRIMTRRIMGKASFCHIQDMSGQLQLYVARDALPENIYNEHFKKWDIGDIIGVEGVLFKTQTDELSVRVEQLRLLTKALRPLPEKFHGLADQEIKYRQRYLDLIMSQDSRNTFLIRSKIVAYIRQFLIERQFLEVETPMMQVIPGGATARPFTTHHNALDMQLYLRIAPELYLKRLVVGGFERVFEINRNFRNEGLSTRHNPEFTMLEFYQAYAEYHDLMDLTEALLRGIAEEVMGSSKITYQGEDYDFAQPFQRMTVVESILHFNPQLTLADLNTRDAAVKVAQGLALPIKDGYGLGKIQIEIFEKTVESRLLQPTFITAYPVEVSPLARRNDNDPHVTDRFEFFVGGREIANGFTELNDAEDQAARFQQQVEEKDAGDDEAMHFDADYITALEHGMPPTAGEGIGIDRLVMLFTDAPSIRDVLLFPHMRPKA
ncbi:MAG: lysine--tRNA ligase [Methylovulum sp.]|jgi:lysyl-tRNA synthetase class 2|nr:lysine--tRNA ligase [Methylovulum sp.]